MDCENGRMVQNGLSSITGELLQQGPDSLFQLLQESG